MPSGATMRDNSRRPSTREANSRPAATSMARTVARRQNVMGPGALCGAAAQAPMGTGTFTPVVNSIVCPLGFLNCNAGPCRHISDFSTRDESIPRSASSRSAAEVAFEQI